MGFNDELNDGRQWKIEIRLLGSFSIRKEAYRKKIKWHLIDALLKHTYTNIYFLTVFLAPEL